MFHSDVGIWSPSPFHPLPYLSWDGGLHSLTLARGLTRHLLPWPAGTQTRCRMGQTRSAGRNRLPRGRRAAGSAKGQELRSLKHRLSQVHGSCGVQEKDTQPPAVAHLPAAVPVGQEPEHYAEHHVAKKHHLRGIETQLWRAHSQLCQEWCSAPLAAGELCARRAAGGTAVPRTTSEGLSGDGFLRVGIYCCIPQSWGWMARISK